jgi:hypothetical protein
MRLYISFRLISSNLWCSIFNDPFPKRTDVIRIGNPSSYYFIFGSMFICLENVAGKQSMNSEVLDMDKVILNGLI